MNNILRAIIGACAVGSMVFLTLAVHTSFELRDRLENARVDRLLAKVVAETGWTLTSIKRLKTACPSSFVGNAYAVDLVIDGNAASAVACFDVDTVYLDVDVEDAEQGASNETRTEVRRDRRASLEEGRDRRVAYAALDHSGARPLRPGPVRTCDPAVPDCGFDDKPPRKRPRPKMGGKGVA